MPEKQDRDILGGLTEKQANKFLDMSSISDVVEGHRNQGQWDDPSQHDIPRENEMKEINLGPVVNPDGSPSDVSLEMMGWTREEWNEKQRQEAADQAYNDPIDGYEAHLQQKEANEYSGITNYPTPGDNEREPEYTNVRRDREPNLYISPFITFNLLLPFLADFLAKNKDTSWNSEDVEANDSWQWTVEEARKLYAELSK